MQPAASVYLITNTFTGQQYVGLTRFTVERRWSQHKTKARSMRYSTDLYHAMITEGLDAFRCEAVASCLSLAYAGWV